MPSTHRNCKVFPCSMISYKKIAVFAVGAALWHRKATFVHTAPCFSYLQVRSKNKTKTECKPWDIFNPDNHFLCRSLTLQLEPSELVVCIMPYIFKMLEDFRIRLK